MTVGGRIRLVHQPNVKLTVELPRQPDVMYWEVGRGREEGRREGLVGEGGGSGGRGDENYGRGWY